MWQLLPDNEWKLNAANKAYEWYIVTSSFRNAKCLHKLSSAFTFSTQTFVIIHANFESLSFKLEYHIRQLMKSFDFISRSPLLRAISMGNQMVTSEIRK